MAEDQLKNQMNAEVATYNLAWGEEQQGAGCLWWACVQLEHSGVLSRGVLSLHTPPWAGVAVTVELVGFGNSCWQNCHQLPCGLKITLNPWLHNLGFSRLSRNCLFGTREKSENFSVRGNSLQKPREIRRKESSQLCWLHFCCLLLADGGAALPFGQDGGRQKSLAWDTAAGDRSRVWSRHMVRPLQPLILFPFSMWWHHLVKGDNTLPILVSHLPLEIYCWSHLPKGEENTGLLQAHTPSSSSVPWG